MLNSVIMGPSHRKITELIRGRTGLIVGWRVVPYTPYPWEPFF